MKYIKKFNLYSINESEDGESLEDYFTSVFDVADIKFSRECGVHDTLEDIAYIIDIKFIVDNPKDHGPYEKANLKFVGEDSSEISLEIFNKFRDPMSDMDVGNYNSLKKTKLIKWIEKSSDYKLYTLPKNLKFKNNDIWGYDLLKKMDMVGRVPVSCGVAPSSIYKFSNLSIRLAFYKK